MIIIRRLLTKSFVTLPLAFAPAPRFVISTAITTTKMRQIHSKLITENSKLKPDRTIKMLHFVHFKSQQSNENSIISSEQLNQILKNLSGSINSFTHEDLVLLLQTISEFPGVSRYNHKNPFLRLLVKKLNMIQIMALNPKYMFKMLNLLEKMAFPKIIITKYANCIAMRDNISEMSVIDTLRFFICMLEMKYIHPAFLSKFYEREIKGINLKNPKEMAYMYYICKTVQKSLQAKINYFNNKLKMNDIVFNPYNQPKTPEVEAALKGTQTMVQRQKANVKQISEGLIAEIRKRIDIKKLKADICRLYGFEKHPLDTTTAVLLHDITELNEVLYGELKKNFKKMQPYQFVALLSTALQTQRLKFFTQYRERVWKYLSLMQKLSLLNIKPQLIRAPVTKQDILDALSQSTKISTRQFDYLSMVSNKHLNEDQQLEIIKAVEALVGDIESK